MNIAIVGFGIEGQASLRYLQGKYADASFTIFDEADALSGVPDGVKLVTGKGAFEKIHDFDLVLRGPSIPPRRLSQTDNLWSGTNEFFADCPAPIIGITGSKGKGTTSSFIAEILRAAGKTVHLLGNIGTPALEILPTIAADDVVVFELSSFQLWDIQRSPQVAVMTLLEPDHLDVHADMAEYVAAKANIFQFQKAGDVAVFNGDDALVREVAEQAVKRTGAHARPFPNKNYAHITDEAFYFGEQKICDTAVVHLPGQHNLRNAAAAINASWDMINGDTDAIRRGLDNFHGLPHRLKLVGEVAGTKFYDDSIATTPGSAIAALRSFDEPKILLLGGYDKGADYHEIGAVIEGLNQNERGNDGEPSVRGVVAFGTNRAKIMTATREVSGVEITEVDTDDFAKKRTELLREKSKNAEALVDLSLDATRTVVAAATQLALPNDIVIMSPAAASFDLYDSYAQRGELFTKVVKELA